MKYFRVLQQDTAPGRHDEYALYEGTNWRDALKEWYNVDTGYIISSTNEDEEIRFTSEDPTANIIYARGWK